MMICVVFVLEVRCVEKKVYRIDTKPKEEKNCQLKALDQCLNKAYYFTHSLNASDSSGDHNQFDNMCRAVIKVINCMDKYFNRCSHPTHKQVYQLGKEQFYESWSEMCTDGPVRQNYIKHSKCIQTAVKESNEYKTKAFEKTRNSNSMMDMINIGCCAFNQWQDCIDSLVQEKCGVDGKRAVMGLIEKASGGIDLSIISVQKITFNRDLKCLVIVVVVIVTLITQCIGEEDEERTQNRAGSSAQSSQMAGSTGNGGT
ncbi:unnamed protein product, partial [Medioppia subpectinata]